MPELMRLSFSLERSLAARLERLCQESSYTNRSEFIRDMIRERLVSREWELNEEAIGTVTLIYDHHARRLSERLTDLQHAHHDAVLATTHVHLDRHMCAEMIMMRGRAEMIRGLTDALRQQKGVLHASLSMSSTGRKLG
jgi:CopG family nickel-responsive transcriptional regulator